MAVGLIKPPEDVIYSAKYNVGELNFDHALSRAIIGALAKGAMTVGDLAKQPGLARASETRLQSGVHTLIAAGQVAPLQRRSLAPRRQPKKENSTCPCR